MICQNAQIAYYQDCRDTNQTGITKNLAIFLHKYIWSVFNTVSMYRNNQSWNATSLLIIVFVF